MTGAINASTSLPATVRPAAPSRAMRLGRTAGPSLSSALNATPSIETPSRFLPGITVAKQQEICTAVRCAGATQVPPAPIRTFVHQPHPHFMVLARLDP